MTFSICCYRKIPVELALWADRRRCANYVDLAGRTRLQAPGLFIKVEGNRLPAILDLPEGEILSLGRVGG